MTRQRAWKLAAGFGAAGVIAFLVFSKGEEKKTGVVWPTEGRPVKVLVIPPSQQEMVRAFPGLAEPIREMQLAFRVSGPLDRLPVHVGQFMRRGELIARIDPRDFKVQVETLAAQRKALTAQLKKARLQYRRYSNLYAIKAAPKAALDDARAARDQLAAQVDATSARLEDARNRLADTRLTAPADGYVDRKHVEVFDNVAAQQPVVAFLDVTEIQVTAGIPEELVADTVHLTGFACEFDAYPGRRFPATLKELGRKPRRSNQSYPLTVKLPVPESVPVRPGMAATIHVTLTDGRPAGILVPVAAVVNDAKGRSFVWVYDKNSQTVKRCDVTTGRLTKAGIELQSGIRSGDRVITAGAHFLHAGQRVTVADETWRPLQDRSAETAPEADRSSGKTD